MVRKSIVEAQEAQRASRGKTNIPAKQKTTTTSTQSPKSFVAITGLDGKLWYVDPLQLGQLPAPTETAAITEITSSLSATTHSTECWEHIGFTTIDEVSTTVDWNDYVEHITENILTTNVTLLQKSGHSPVNFLKTISFLINSSATVHISPCHTDFSTL